MKNVFFDFFSTWELKSKNNESEITIELLKSIY